MTACQYVREYYGVPATIGRLVTINGKRGIIAADRGHYIGVNFDHDEPGVILNAHPTWEVVYGEMGEVRQPNRAQGAYRDYLHSECCESFAEWLGIELPCVRHESHWNREKECREDLYKYERFKRVDYDYTEYIQGEWKPTKKEAKASYKAALKAHKAQQKAWAAA
jgi:hypothetical protein